MQERERERERKVLENDKIRKNMCIRVKGGKN
jgi:hypothetical protein